jgi:hypothetical protein
MQSLVRTSTLVAMVPFIVDVPILNPYVVASYCTSYLTKVDKNVTQELHTMLEKCKTKKPKAFQCI